LFHYQFVTYISDGQRKVHFKEMAGTKSKNNKDNQKDKDSSFAKSGKSSSSKESQPILRENKSKVNNQTVKAASSSNILQKAIQDRSEEINAKIKIDQKFKSKGELLIVCPRITKAFINLLKSVTLSKETLIRLNLCEDTKNVKNRPTEMASLDSNSKVPMLTTREAKDTKENSLHTQEEQASLNKDQNLSGDYGSSVHGDKDTKIGDEEPSIKRRTDSGVKPDTIECEKSKNPSLKLQQQEKEKHRFESPKLPSTFIQSPSRSSTRSVLKNSRVLFSQEDTNNNEQIKGKLQKSTTLKLATPSTLLASPNTSFSKQKNILNESGREKPTINSVTDEMLKKVSLCVTEKVFCPEKGSACHHCRLKSLDTKTICRSGRCEGEQGQFCGPCLVGFYVEDPKEALKDPTWICPPCRDICRCSVCQNREETNGRILSAQSLTKGFDSVTKFLTNLIENY
jgi:hypothetical protein